ncbi:MAG: polysaccharide biosynthesis protein, partial [Pseudomonas sp.]
MDKIRAKLLSLPRRHKRILQVLTDISLVWCALWMAFVVRLGVDELVNPFTQHVWLFVSAPVIAIIKAVTLSSLILGIVVYWY